MPTRELHDVVYQDIIAQMEHLEKHNYPLPKEYDKNKHDISDNEIRLYEQQLQRDKHRDSKKVSGMIAISATCLSQFCQLMQIDYLKTKNLPKLIREAIADGEFDDYMEGLGEYLRGSVVDHPIFSIALKFVEKVGEAHNMETEEEQERLEEEEAQREKRHAESLRSLNKLRVPNVPSPKYTKKNAPKQVSSEKSVDTRNEKKDEFHGDRKSEMKVDTRPKRGQRVVIDEEKVEKEKVFKREQETKRLQAEQEALKERQRIEQEEALKERLKEEQAKFKIQERREELQKQHAEQKKLEEKLEQEKLEQEKLQKQKLEQEKLEQPTEPRKGKKGFKRCTDLALPKGMEKLMENLQAPMKEMKAMMSDEQQIVEEEQSAQQGFHNVSF